MRPRRQARAMTDTRADTRLMTYAELGEAIGRSEPAARAMAIRKHWRRVLGNDGKARVAVPIETLEKLRAQAAARADDQPEDQANTEADDRPDPLPDGSADARALIAMLETRVAEVTSEIKETRADLKVAQTVIAELTAQAARVEGLEALLAAERERIAEAKEAERLRVEEMRQRAEEARQRADELKAERDRWIMAAETAQERIDHLTTKAAEAEKRKGWWPFRKAG